MGWNFRTGATAIVASLALINSTSSGAQESLSLGQDRILIDTSVFNDRQLERLQTPLFGQQRPGEGVVAIDYDDWVTAYPDLIRDPLLDRRRLDLSVLLPRSHPFFQRGQYERAFDPEVAIRAVRLVLDVAALKCSREATVAARQLCLTNENVPELEAIVRGLDNAPDCPDAVKAFYDLDDPCRQGPCVTSSAREAYAKLDDQCMTALTPWIDRNGIRHDAAPVGILTPGPDGQSALDAIVLIQIARPGEDWRPYCGGMLLQGSRVLTARHCLGKIEHRNALRDSRVRALRTSDGETFELGWTEEARKPEGDITDDVLIVPIRLRSDQSAPKPPAVVLKSVDAPAPAVALGYLHFRDYERRSGSNEAVVSPVDWRAGLRYARPGLCHVVRENAGCVRTLCQTFPGYSGGPIFAEERDDAGRLVLYGLVSQASHNEESLSCSAPPLIAPTESSDRVSTDAVFPAGLNLGA